jgi:hypothetical protein
MTFRSYEGGGKIQHEFGEKPTATDWTDATVSPYDGLGTTFIRDMDDSSRPH